MNLGDRCVLVVCAGRLIPSHEAGRSHGEAVEESGPHGRGLMLVKAGEYHTGGVVGPEDADDMVFDEEDRPEDGCDNKAEHVRAYNLSNVGQRTSLEMMHPTAISYTYSGDIGIPLAV